MSVDYTNFCGRVVAENRGGVVSTYVSDPLGSIIGLIDSAGAMTDRWTYWPYGEVATRTGTNPTPLTFLGVLGYFQDVLSKLFYARARHLRVDLARWLTVDPLWPNQPAYAYVGNEPVVHTDPSGTQIMDWPCGASSVHWCMSVCISRREAYAICWVVWFIPCCVCWSKLVVKI